MQEQLWAKHRNMDIYKQTALGMQAKRYDSDMQKCCETEGTSPGYHKARERNNRSDAVPQTCHFDDQLHIILGRDLTRTPPTTVEILEEPDTEIPAMNSKEE